MSAPHASARDRTAAGLNRVAITGMGVVSALGEGVAAHVAGLDAGRDGVAEMQFPDVDRLAIRIGAQIRDLDPAARFARNDLSLYDRLTQLALIAAREAMAGVEVDEALALRAAVVTGTALLGMETVDDNYRQVFQEGRNRVHPFVVPKLMNSAPCSFISMEFGLKGPAWSVSTACSSANHAIGQAFQLVRAGAVDLAVTGGVEAPLTFGTLKAWEGLRVMTRDACRPFSKGRTGMVLGEGAAIFTLESFAHARARGATILAELAGAGMSSDAGDIVMPSADGAARAIAAALADAGMAPEEVGYVNAHGTGTAANDKTEVQALRAVFGAHADRLAVSSTKSMHGHALGAAGALELVAVVHALRSGRLPPTINWQAADPECDLDVIPNESRAVQVEAAISDSFAFGGLNAVLAVRRAPD